ASRTAASADFIARHSGTAAPASLSRPSARTASTRTAGSSMARSEEHTSELQSLTNLVCRLLLEKKYYTGVIVLTDGGSCTPCVATPSHSTAANSTAAGPKRGAEFRTVRRVPTLWLSLPYSPRTP